jgi:hypothetical protein
MVCSRACNAPVDRGRAAPAAFFIPSWNLWGFNTRLSSSAQAQVERPPRGPDSRLSMFSWPRRWVRRMGPLVAVREAAPTISPLPAQQPLAARAAHASAVGVHRLALPVLALPVRPAAVGLTDVGLQPVLVQARTVPLLWYPLSVTISSPAAGGAAPGGWQGDLPEVPARLVHGLPHRLRVPPVGAGWSVTENTAPCPCPPRRPPVREMGSPVLHLVMRASGSLRVRQVVVGAFLGRFRLSGPGPRGSAS